MESDANKMKQSARETPEVQAAQCGGRIIKLENAIIYNNLTLFTFKLLNN